MAEKLELDKATEHEVHGEATHSQGAEEITLSPRDDIHEVTEATMEETILKLKQQQAEAEEWLARYRGPGTMAEEEIPRERQRMKDDLAKAQARIAELEKAQGSQEPLHTATAELERSTEELKRVSKNLSARAELFSERLEDSMPSKRFAWVKWFILLLSGISLAIFSDVYFRIGGHDGGGVSPHSYDVISGWMIGLALLGYFLDN